MIATIGPSLEEGAEGGLLLCLKLSQSSSEPYGLGLSVEKGPPPPPRPPYTLKP